MSNMMHDTYSTQSDSTERSFVEPSVTIESVTFSDGQRFLIEQKDVVVLVGPNNSGKSVALRDIEGLLDVNYLGTVAKETTIRRVGNESDVRSYLERHARVVESRSDRQYKGYKYNLHDSHISSYWTNNAGIFSKLFCLRMTTETRLTDSNPANAIQVLKDQVSHPIQMLYSDDRLEDRVSDFFYRAFGKDLIVFRSGGRTIPLLVGDRIEPEEGERTYSHSYIERLLGATVELQEQGDGMRSFSSVILHLLAPVTPSLLLLDEPEAFLHPPQARVLGELIATERSSRCQLFVATHSPDVLQGLLDGAGDHLRVLRVCRDGDINLIKELDKGRAKQISRDPLMKYSSVLSGVFHERVIICESESDCLFYSSILNQEAVSGSRNPDVFFVHANGKDRMSILAEALRELDVKVDVIVDFDVLKSDETVRKLVEILGMHWDTVRPLVNSIRTGVQQKKPWLNAKEIKKAIRKELSGVGGMREFPRSARHAIQKIFRKASPWDAIKEAGESALPQGQATRDFDRLRSLCGNYGLWIVPVGELEGFCKSIGGHGSAWVRGVIEEYDLSSEPSLERAREFMREVWTFR